MNERKQEKRLKLLTNNEPKQRMKRKEKYEKVENKTQTTEIKKNEK